MKMHQQMDKFYKDKETVTISNCEIRPSKVDDELEIIVKSSSGLQRSPTKFQIPDKLASTLSSALRLSMWKNCRRFRSQLKLC